MISQLTGRIVSATSDEVVIDVGGVGYSLLVSKTTFAALMGQQGQMVTLPVETHVREDHIHLYGFLTAEDKAWFKKLTNVSGVGAKTAQNILSACPPQRLVGAIAANDVKAISAAEGVGPKVAQRIIMELKDKLPKTSSVTPIVALKSNAEPSVVEDAVSALVHLGYDRTLAHQTCARIAYSNDNQIAFDALLKTALQELSS